MRIRNFKHSIAFDSAHPDMLRRTSTPLGEPSVDFMRLGEPLVGFTRLDESSVDFMRLEESWGDYGCLLVTTGKAPEPGSGATPYPPKPTGLDNTVGPVPKISGYVFNTLQTNSAAHVPNTNMNLINEDTHICDLSLYQTIFQNMEYQTYNFTGSDLESTSDQGLPIKDLFGHPPKNLFFTLACKNT